MRLMTVCWKHKERKCIKLVAVQCLAGWPLLLQWSHFLMLLALTDGVHKKGNLASNASKLLTAAASVTATAVVATSGALIRRPPRAHSITDRSTCNELQQLASQPCHSCLWQIDGDHAVCGRVCCCQGSCQGRSDHGPGPNLLQGTQFRLLGNIMYDVQLLHCFEP